MRRSLVVLLSCTLGCTAAPGEARPHDRPAAAQPPNVVFILADDLGWADIAPFGQKQVPTPNLDRLAAEGMMFIRHYAGSTVCSPSRASLMTGRDTGHAPIRGNREIKGASEAESGQAPLPAATYTLGSLFRQAGYSTAAIGKWGLGPAASSGAPWKQGFDYFFGYIDQRAAHSYFPPSLWRNNEVVRLNNPAIPRSERLKGDPADSRAYERYVGPDYAQERLTLDALDFVGRQPLDKRFFLYLAYTLPHAEMQLPYAERDRFRRLPEAGPYLGKPYTPQQYPRATRAAMVARLDADVGRVMQALKSRGLDKDTLVVFTSDNGPTREGGQDLAFFQSTGNLRGVKRDLYEGGIRVPLIARWPGHVPAGTRSDAVTAFWDYMPTFGALLGKHAGAPEGHSFLPVLLGKPAKKRGPLYWEYHGAGTVPHSQAVRMGDWKVIRLWPSNASTPKVELYDLAKDPGEARDIASEHRDIVRRGIAIMDRRTASAIPGWNFDQAGEDE